MLTGKADERAKGWLEDNGHSPDYRLKFYGEDGKAVAVDTESLQEGANLPENVFVRLSDVALFFLHKSGGYRLFVDMPWSDWEGQPCMVERPEEAVKIDAQYIDYQEAEAILGRVLKDDPPSEEEIVFWLGTGELTAWEHPYANAGKVDCSKQVHETFTVTVKGLEEWRLPEKPSCLDGIAQRIDTFYFSRRQLEAFRPATRWRSYDYVAALGKRYGMGQARMNRLIWNSPQSQLRGFYLAENSPFSGPETQEALQPVGQYIEEHFYPSGWVKQLEGNLAQRRAQLMKGVEDDTEGSAEEQDGAAKTGANLGEDEKGEPQGFKPAGLSIPATPYDYGHALKQDAWAVWEALCWLHGDDPMYYRSDIERDYPMEVDLVKRAVKAGRLTPEGSSPRQWVEWAISKGWAVPERLRLFVEAQPCPAQEAPKPEPSTASDPRRFHHQAFGTRITVDEMRERWGHSNNKYLDELARLGELIPWYGREGIAIYTRPKGLGCQFGIPPDIKWSDKRGVVFDANKVVWVDTLPDEAYYGLPFILEYEEKNPHLKQKAEPISASNRTAGNGIMSGESADVKPLEARSIDGLGEEAGNEEPAKQADKAMEAQGEPIVERTGPRGKVDTEESAGGEGGATGTGGSLGVEGKVEKADAQAQKERVEIEASKTGGQQKFSDFFYIERKRTAWCDPIEAVGEELFSTLGRMPTEHEIWAKLCELPQGSYAIVKVSKNRMDIGDYRLYFSKLRTHWTNWTKKPKKARG